MKEGDIIQIKVTSIGRRGDGVGKYEDMVVFVKNAEVDKEYKVKIDGVYPNFCFAQIMEEL